MTRYITKLFFVSAFLFVGTAADIFASGGNLDTSFNGTGKSIFNIESAEVFGNFTNVVVTGGNKFLVVGQARVANGSYCAITLTRYNSDGTLDTSFGTGGKVITDAGVSMKGVAIALQSDGKIIVGAQDGTFYSGFSTVLRYTPDGALDTTFAGGTGIFFNSVMKLAQDISILPDNSILIAGDNTNYPIYTGHTLLTKLTPNGTLDNAFGTNGVVSTTYSSPSQTDQIVVQNDGKIVVSSTSLEAYKWLVERFNSNGTPDTTFGTNGRRDIDLNGLQWAGGLGLQPDGKLVLGGDITVSGNNTQIMLTRLNSNGTTDQGFGRVTPGYVFYDLTPNRDRSYDLALQTDGKILLSGLQDLFYPTVNAYVARFDATGAIDTDFGMGGIALIPASMNAGAIALQGSNVVAIEEPVNTAGYTFHVSRLSPTGAILSDVLETFIVGKNDEARDVAMQADGKIVTAGVSVNGENRGVVSVARTLPNGTLDASFGNGGVATICGGYNCAANAVAVQPDGKIVVAGQISQEIYSYGALFVARLNADGTPDNTFGTGGRVLIVGPSMYGVNSLSGQDVALQPDGKIVVAGRSDRTAAQGTPDTDMMVTRLNTNGTSDGQWISFIGAQGFPPVPFGDQSYALTIQPDGKIVLAGTHLLRLNSDLTIDSGFSSTLVNIGFVATDVKLQPDGKIVLSGAAGGDFYLTRFDTNASIDTGFGSNGYAVLDFGGTDVANSIFLDPNGDIVAGGSTLGNSNYKRFALARFKSNGSPDLSFGNGGKVITDFGGDAGILGLARQSDGKIVAAGDAKMGIDRDFAIARYLARSALFDFDGDGKTDVSIFRPSNGDWWYRKSSNNGNAAFHFGASADKIVPADYTGDGRTDIALFRPSTGQWFVLRSENNSYYSNPFGLSTDIPAPGDFDADGKADEAVFRPSNGRWYINRSSGGITIQQFGQSGDVPVVADYDGDGKSDIAIYRPSLGQWWIQRSTAGLIAYTFGNSADRTVAGDYTGDGKADVAVWRPSTGEWFVLRSENNSYYSFPFGLPDDVPAPGDYDGDGKSDAAVFRPSNSVWYLQRSTSGFTAVQFGLSGDIPAPSAFVR